MADTSIAREGGNFVHFEMIEGEYPTAQLFNEVLREALEEAIEIPAEESRRILGRMRSEQTGTGQYQTNPHPPPPLADRLFSYAYFHADGTARAGFALDGDVAYIGWFLEYGWTQVLWGQYTNMETGPYPFLRPAYDKTRTEMIDTVKRLVRQKLAERNTRRAA